MRAHDPKISQPKKLSEAKLEAKTSSETKPLALPKAPTWVSCDPLDIMETGLLPLVRRYGATINRIAGAYTVKDAWMHAYTGGVIHMEWVDGNLQESPLVLEKYYKELKTPWVWWSEKRHEPSDMSERMKWLGLYPIDRVWAMSYNVKELVAHERPAKWLVRIAKNRKEFDGYSLIFRLSQGYSQGFTEKCLQQLRMTVGSDNIYHHTAFYRGKSVAMGSFHRFSTYGLISHLGVHPSWLRSGIGTLMLEELLACSYVFGLKYALAFVPESAKPFFERLGFRSHMAFDIYGNDQITSRLRQPADFSSFPPYTPKMILEPTATIPEDLEPTVASLVAAARKAQGLR